MTMTTTTADSKDMGVRPTHQMAWFHDLESANRFLAMAAPAMRIISTQVVPIGTAGDVMVVITVEMHRHTFDRNDFKDMVKEARKQAWGNDDK